MDSGDIKDVGGVIADPGDITGVSGQYGGGMFDPIGIGKNSSKKNAPPPQDYKGAAEAQGQSGQASINYQTQSNRPDQYTGFGSNTWTKDDKGNWVQNTGLNQQLGGALGNLQGQAFANSQKPMDNGSAARDQAISAAYNQATSRLNPQWQTSDEQLQTQLANQGLDPNSASSRAAMLQQSQAKNDAYGSAMANAIAQGTAAQQATFNENLQAQMAPYQQMGYLQNFQNGLPGFNAAGAWQPTQYLPAAEALGNYNMNAWLGTNQAKADMYGGLGQFGGSLIGAFMSDARVKTDIKRLPVEAHPGIPLATFKYKHAPEKGHHLGVIAQDVEKVRPDAVHANEAGIKSVDYSKLKPFGVK